MSKSTISTFQLFAQFPDQESARIYLESILWPNGPQCSICQSTERITARKGGFYRCLACKDDFTVRTEPSLEGRMFRCINGSTQSISWSLRARASPVCNWGKRSGFGRRQHGSRSEEHTSEL